jgi:hypothetical protein
MVKICQNSRIMGQSPPIHEEIVRMDWINDGVFSCGLIPPMNNAMIQLSKERRFRVIMP